MNRLQRFLNTFAPTKEASAKHKIVEFAKRRISPSVDDFVNAVEAALSKTQQTRITLYDHYKQTLLFDNVVTSLIEKRLDNIDNKKVVLYKGEAPVEDINYFLSAPEFRLFLRDIVMSKKFWGFGLFEFDEYEYDNKKWFRHKVIPIKHVNPYAVEILEMQNDSNGWAVGDRNDYMFIGDPDDLGLMLQVTLLSLYRRLGMFNYGKYVDLASENFMQLVQREFTDNANIASLQDSISKRAAGGILSLPDGVDLRSENQSSSQQNQLFEGYMQLLKDELAVLILGQTMTTEDGASRSQAEVHQIEQGAKYSADEQMIVDILNYEFKDRLPLWGFEVTSDMRFALEPTSYEELNMNLRNLKALKELGLELTTDELKEKFKEIL